MQTHRSRKRTAGLTAVALLSVGVGVAAAAAGPGSGSPGRAHSHTRGTVFEATATYRGQTYTARTVS